MGSNFSEVSRLNAIPVAYRAVVLKALPAGKKWPSTIKKVARLFVSNRAIIARQRINNLYVIGAYKSVLISMIV